jgi:hypothetical protein
LDDHRMGSTDDNPAPGRIADEDFTGAAALMQER